MAEPADGRQLDLIMYRWPSETPMGPFIVGSLQLLPAPCCVMIVHPSERVSNAVLSITYLYAALLCRDSTTIPTFLTLYLGSFRVPLQCFLLDGFPNDRAPETSAGITEP